MRSDSLTGWLILSNLNNSAHSFTVEYEGEECPYTYTGVRLSLQKNVVATHYLFNLEHCKIWIWRKQARSAWRMCLGNFDLGYARNSGPNTYLTKPYCTTPTLIKLSIFNHHLVWMYKLCYLNSCLINIIIISHFF